MSGISGRIRRLAVSGVAGVLLVGLLATGVSAAPQPLTIETAIYDGAVWGQVRSNAYVEVVVRDAAGHLLGKGLADSYGGYWEFWDFAGAIYPGYTVKATAFNTQGTLETRKLTVPALTISADRGTNVVSGTAPANSAVTLRAADGRWEAWGESYDVSKVKTVDATGHFAFDFDKIGVNLRGGAAVAVAWTNSTKTASVWRYATVPRIMLAKGIAEFAAETRKNVHVEATLRDASSNVLAVGHAVGGWDGWANGTFATATLDDYIVQGGEHLSAPAIASDVDWLIPTGISSVDVTTDKIYGNCFPNGRYQVYALDPVNWEEAYKFGTASATGAVTKDMTSVFNIRKNSYVELLCWTSEADYVYSTHGTYSNYSSAQAAFSSMDRASRVSSFLKHR